MKKKKLKPIKIKVNIFLFYNQSDKIKFRYKKGEKGVINIYINRSKIKK